MSIRRVLVTAAVLAVCGGTLAGAAAPPATVVATINVGRGAGVPAVDATAVWVPLTKLGSIARVDIARKRVVKTIKLGAPPRFTGYLDAAVSPAAASGSRVTSGDEVDRIDPKTNRLVAPDQGRLSPRRARRRRRVRLGVPLPRPYLTASTRRRAKKACSRSTARPAPGSPRRRRGLAPDREPVAVIKLDPASGAVLAKIALTPSPPPKHGIVETWWVAAGGGSLWVVIANWDRVGRVDERDGEGRRVDPGPGPDPVRRAWYRGAAWVAGEGKVVRIDPATNQVGRRGHALAALAAGLHPGRRRALPGCGRPTTTQGCCTGSACPECHSIGA